MHSFENRRVSISEFSSCVTSEDGCGRAVPHLQNNSYGDFQHSKQCKYKEKYLSKFSNVHKRKQTSLLAKVNSRCFFPISGRHVGAHGVSMASRFLFWWRDSENRQLNFTLILRERYWRREAYVKGLNQVYNILVQSNEYTDYGLISHSKSCLGSLYFPYTDSCVHVFRTFRAVHQASSNFTDRNKNDSYSHLFFS